MSKVKIGFSGLTVPEQIERARNIETKITGNPLYPTPVPPLAVVNGAITALENAYNESRGRDKNKVAAMKLRRKELLFIMGQEAAYVQEASGGNQEAILSSGFDVVSPKTPRPDIAGPVNDVRVKSGSTNGKIHANWDKASDAVMYVVLVSLSADFSNPEPKGITTKTQKEIGEFASGTNVWVAIRGLGREEAGPQSDPVHILVR